MSTHASNRGAASLGTAVLGSVGRSADRRQQTKDLVLDTALRLFNEHGYLGVRVEDIAKESGVSRATFYKHFAEREQVLAELFQRLLGGADAGLPTSVVEPTTTGSVEQQVTDVVEAAVERMLEQEMLAKFVYSLPVRHSALLRPGVRTAPPVFERVAHLIEQGVARGEVRDDVPVALLVRHILGAMENAMRDWAEDRVDDPLSQVRLMLGLGFHGVTNH